MTFGEKLKSARIESGLKQIELAKKLGTTGNTISNWENNVSKPDLDTLSYICGILHVTASYFLQATIPDDEVTIPELKLIKKYRNLDDFGRQRIEYELDTETERVKEIRQQKKYIESQKSETSAELIPSRIITYFHRIASAGSGEYLFDNMPTDLIRVKDTPVSRRADFVIGVNGDSMEPDYYNGEKVFVETSPNVAVGEVGIFLRGSECFMKECGKDGLISRNPKYPNVEPFSDGVKIVGKVIGKADLVDG